MPAFNRVNTLGEALAEKVHNFASDSLRIALTNVTPLVTNSVLTDITEIAYTNMSSRVLTVASSSQTAGVYKLVINDLTLTSTGGATGPFRFVVIFNDTAANKELIGFSDYGSALTINDGESLIVDFDAANGLLTI